MNHSITQRINVSFTNDGVPPIVKAMQYDNNMRIVEAVMTANGVPYQVPDGYSVNIRMRKPDGTCVYNPALEVTGNTAKIVLTQQMLTISGKAAAILEVTGGENGADVLGTASWCIDVAPNPVPEEFVESTDEFKTIQQLVEEAKELLQRRGTCYGFHVDGSESDPAGKITYLRDAVGMTPARMNYTSGRFDYGSWKDAFFMPRPCMLRYDGTVDYYLDPEDYTKREDGSDSDVANVDYAGNAMMEWGRDGRQIWWKCEADADDASSGSVYIADYQVDSTFHNWNFINCKGNAAAHFYTPCFNGALDSAGRMRSISGLAPVNSKNAQQEIDAAKLNNLTDNVIWYTETYADVQLINFLLLLMGRNTDTQTVFGNGHYTGGSSASSLLNTGTMNARGLFWGAKGTGIGVKVFGMENWWGNQWRRYAGHINASGTQKVKLTFGPEDGSTAAAYNTTGDGYISVGATPGGTTGGYITNMNFSKDGMLPQTATGSNTTYYCDGLWFNNGKTDYACRGGLCDAGWRVGALCCDLSVAPSSAWWGVGAAPSCKPLV